VALKKTIQISADQNPELIAGMKIKINNQVIDASLKNKIKQVRELLRA